MATLICHKDMKTTVKFNIGGSHYEVSRSLLERYPDTMLARMTSELWHHENADDKDEALFIERDGERFKFVLDFMRDGKISLPASTVTKGALLNDLEYYGFENISTDVITVCGAPTESIEHLVNFERECYTKRIEDLTEHIDNIQWEISAVEVAYHCCYCVYRDSQELALTIRKGQGDKMLQQHIAYVMKRGHPAFNEILKDFGFECTMMNFYVSPERYFIKFKKLD